MKKVNIRNFLCFLTIAFFGVLTPLELKAQRYEVGGGLGISTYSGDIIRRWDFNQIGLQGTLFGRRNFDNVWSLRSGLSVARLNGADSIRPIDPVATYRNAHFRGTMVEFSAVMEYHFLDFTHTQAQFRYSPYGFFGLGYGLFFGNGQTFEGDPTAGRYSNGSLVIPFGLGMKYRLTERLILAGELGFRATFTDQLDKIDSNQLPISRFPDTANPNQLTGYNYGNYSDKDWYYFFGVTLSYSFSAVKCYAY